MPPESDLPCPQCGGTGWIPVEPDDPEAEAGRRADGPTTRARARSLGAAQTGAAGGVVAGFVLRRLSRLGFGIVLHASVQLVLGRLR